MVKPKTSSFKERKGRLLSRSYLLLFLLFISFSAYSQNVQIKSSEMSVLDIFKTVKDQTGIITVFSNDELDAGKKIQLKVQTYDLKALYSTILKDENLDFSISDKYVTIILKQENKNMGNPKDNIAPVAQAQNQPSVNAIRGIVKDKDGDPLPGVNVRLADIPLGTLTDYEGAYTLVVPQQVPSGSKILYTMIGMKQEERLYTGKPSTINIVMEEDVKLLEEVVVTGYQSINRKDMVGAYTQLKAKDILLPSQSSIDEMLQGQVAGLIVTNSSLRAGSTPNISLRGQTTVLGNTQPLWVIDGIIQPAVEDYQKIGTLLGAGQGTGGADIKEVISGQISWLNPSDIETITVLKDASATAIYGSRASNGVIVLTTKKGTESSKPFVSYTGSATVRPRPTYDDYNLMNSQERITFSRLLSEQGEITPANAAVVFKDMNTYEGLKLLYTDRLISENQLIQRYNYLETLNTDWLELLTRTSVVTNHNLSISGGSKATKYSASLGYQNTQGLEIGNDKTRYSGRMRLGFDLSPTLNIDFISAFTMNNTNTFAGGVNPLRYARTTSRALPAYDEEGNYAYYKKDFYMYNDKTQNTGLNYSVLNDRDHTGSTIKEPRFDASINLSWKINPRFTYQLVGGFISQTRNLEAYADAESSYINANYRGYDLGSITTNDPEYNAALLRFGGMLEAENMRSQTLNMQHKLLFEKVVNKDHRFNAMAAWEVKSVNIAVKNNTAYGYMRSYGEQIATPTTYKEFVSMSSLRPNYPDHGIFKDNFSKILDSRTATLNDLSAFATLAYTFRSRYILNANARNDVSNRFGRDANKILNPTYSLGAKWRVCEEPFMKNIQSTFLDQLNLSATYGIQGNVLNLASPELILRNYKPDSNLGQMVASISKLPNPELSWERTKTWDLGADFGILNGLITADLHYYYRKSAVAMETAQTAENGGKGFSAPQNGVYLLNTGGELTINVTPVNKKDWLFTFSFNTSKNWNKITDIVDKSQNISTVNYLSGNGNGNTSLIEPNYPIGGFWRFDFGGLDDRGYPIINRLNPDDPNYSTKHTDFLVYAGTEIPSMTGGLNLTLRYKSLTLTSSFAAVMGKTTVLPNPYQEITTGTNSDRFVVPNPTTNLNRNLVDRWMTAGDENRTIYPVIDVNMLKNYTNSLIDPGTSGSPTRTLMFLWERSTALTVDASFIRCRDIALRWAIPVTYLKRVGIKNCSLNASVSNLFVVADKKWQGMDPELGNAVVPKSYSLGINLGF